MSGPAAYRIETQRSAARALSQLRDPIQNTLREAIRELAHDPTPPESIPLTGKAQGMHRLRVGAYRIVYRILSEPSRIRIIRVGHRSTIYHGLEGREQQKGT